MLVMVAKFCSSDDCIVFAVAGTTRLMTVSHMWLLTHWVKTLLHNCRLPLSQPG